MLGAAALTLASCSSDFLEEYSQDLSRPTTATDLEELLMGDCLMPLGYIGIDNSMLNTENENYAVLHFMGDELQENISVEGRPAPETTSQNYFPFFTWQKNTYVDYQDRASYTSREARYWDLAYEKIDHCNMIIGQADEMNFSSDDDRLLAQHVKGECHYLRASYYLMLVNLYGKPYTPSTASQNPGVPIKTTPYIEDKAYSRASVAECYRQIVSDLTAAEQELADVTTAESIYHVSLTAVYILRSRVALYMQDWDTARHYATLALEKNSQLQNMVGWSSDNYPISSSNPEVVYSNGASCFGNLIYLYPGRRSSSYSTYSPVYEVSDHLVSLFEQGDGRRNGYITNQDNPTYHRWSYHKIDNSRANLGTYKTVSDVFSLRTAEAYLNLAEADAQLGNDQEANEYLNRLRRTRIANAATINLSGSGLITAIREERERELCFEGHRWFDLRRYMVDARHPFTKTIEHTFTAYAYDSYNYSYNKQFTRYYRLEQNDEAYTLNIPKNVRDFQNSIGSNERPDRQPYNVVLGESGGGDEDGYDN